MAFHEQLAVGEQSLLPFSQNPLKRHLGRRRYEVRRIRARRADVSHPAIEQFLEHLGTADELLGLRRGAPIGGDKLLEHGQNIVSDQAFEEPLDPAWLPGAHSPTPSILANWTKVSKCVDLP
ncbi:hypothetical protein [Actinoallomurus acaciae]|uniref:Uncharacterized protein n=1 Tax=Actinoallomurus acaciae TaxID=502577 RepID=A0ABV5Y7Z6_9ACTN